jgi:hypothetical protein
VSPCARMKYLDVVYCLHRICACIEVVGSGSSSLNNREMAFEVAVVK